MNQLCYVYIVILCLISLKTIELSFYFSYSDVEGGLQGLLSLPLGRVIVPPTGEGDCGGV